MTQIFEAHMAEPAAQLELARATAIAADRKTVLLCYEADACGCHRKILAETIAESLGCEIENL